MTDFKKGGAPIPDYDKDDINYISQKTEFTDDVFIYGKLYADFADFTISNTKPLIILDDTSNRGLEFRGPSEKSEASIITTSPNTLALGANNEECLKIEPGCKVTIGTGVTIEKNGQSQFSGIVTFSNAKGTFSGDGSGLFGVIGVGQGIEIQNDASVVGAAGTVNFGNNLSVSPLSLGAVTVHASQNFTGVVTATSFNGDGVVPSGAILMYTGTTAPAGWVLCDDSTAAQNAGAPDLRDRFIVGAYPTGGSSTYPNLTKDSTGGSANATLVRHSHTVNSHTHGDGTYAAASSGSHNHSYTVRLANVNNDNDEANSSCSTANSTQTTGNSGAHTHNVSGTSGAASPGTNQQGASADNANLPPYYALCFIMKT